MPNCNGTCRLCGGEVLGWAMWECVPEEHAHCIWCVDAILTYLQERVEHRPFSRIDNLLPEFVRSGK